MIPNSSDSECYEVGLVGVVGVVNAMLSPLIANRQDLPCLANSLVTTSCCYPKA